MSKHTPGPWLTAGEDKAFVYALSPNGINSFWAHVQTAGQDRISDTEKNANARLIAAAPELLEACEAAIRYDAVIQTCANDPERMSSACTAEGDDLDGLYNDWISKARAAIRKATGEA